MPHERNPADRDPPLAPGARECVAALQARWPDAVRSDALARALYATDASIYQIAPTAVVWPRDVEEVAEAVRICAAHATPVTARGAGTGLTGGAVNRGVILDLSRHLRGWRFDPATQTAVVQPGVVLDELNANLRAHHLHFAPDVATSSRATLGGMIANNSAGAHSIRYGRTVDHVIGLEAVLADGSRARFGQGAPASRPADSLAGRGEAALRAVATELADEVCARYPKVMRSNAGYALDRLRVAGAGDGVNTEAVICGSEGTLAVVVEATLHLEPIPRCTGLVVVHFADLAEALAAVPRVLAHQPAAVEVMDDLILTAAAQNLALAEARRFVQGEPAALLVCEHFADSPDELTDRLHTLAGDLRAAGLGYAHPVFTDTKQQAQVWSVRKAGLGLLQSRPGDHQPYAFIEDTAVDPARLPEYITDLRALLREEGVERVSCHAHASAGCLHVRPILNLKQADDVQRMARIAQRVVGLVRQYGGTITGEHGDGLVRSSWLADLYGPRIVEGFGRIKRAFDPQGILNPGKIVDPLPMTEHLRFGPGFVDTPLATFLDFSRYGGPAGLAQMCTGVGACRQRTPATTMCPSFRATGDETHTTRARANALRLALSNGSLLQGLADPAVAEVMDLCLSCKACRTECPTGVDIAKLKAEWLAQQHLRTGVPARNRLIGDMPQLLPWARWFAPLSNWVTGSRIARAWLEHHFGLDRRFPPPPVVRRTFRRWFAQHRKQQRRARADESAAGRRLPVVYFVDTWTNFYTPQVGIAAVRVLEALGYAVIVPDTHCCGRPMISKGLLAEAKLLAERNVQVLSPWAARGVPIVGTEPSCVSAIVDEWPQLTRTAAARHVATHAEPIERFLLAAFHQQPDRWPAPPPGPPVLFHGHCHQKAMFGTQPVLELLGQATGGEAREIDSGCCGMAGSFGHEVEHYDVARAVGEERLFPAVRARGEAAVAVAGFSCREHIAHHTHAPVRHWLEILAERMGT